MLFRSFQLSWILVFVCLIMVNLQIRGNFASWPPPGVEPLDPVLPTIATLGLLASAVLARAGLQAIQHDRRDALRSYWLATVALGVGFVLILAFAWPRVPFSGPYSTVFRVMTAFHSVHALVIGLILFRVLSRAADYDSVHNWAVEASTKLWYFVVVAWLLFYTVLYLI